MCNNLRKVRYRLQFALSVMAVALCCTLNSCSDDDPLKDGGNVRLKSFGIYDESWEIDYTNKWEINTIYHDGSQSGHVRYVDDKIYLTLVSFEPTVTISLNNGKVTKFDRKDREAYTVSYDNQGRISEIKPSDSDSDWSVLYVWDKNDLLQKVINKTKDRYSDKYNVDEYAFEYSDEYSNGAVDPVCIDVLNRYTLSRQGLNSYMWKCSLFLAPKSFGKMPHKLISKVTYKPHEEWDKYKIDITIGDIDTDGCVCQYQERTYDCGWTSSSGNITTSFKWEKIK